MAEENLTFWQISINTGIHSRSISRWLNKPVKPQLLKLKKICDFLDIGEENYIQDYDVEIITGYGIIKKYLRKHGYDGLCMEECGCGLDDFAPADCVTNECIPAYKVKCDCGDCFGSVFSPDKKEIPEHG